jgi:hypothetical protein
MIAQYFLFLIFSSENGLMGVISAGYSLLIEADWMDQDYDLDDESGRDQNTTENSDKGAIESTDSAHEADDQTKDEPCGTLEDFLIKLLFHSRISFSFHFCHFYFPSISSN